MQYLLQAYSAWRLMKHRSTLHHPSLTRSQLTISQQDSCCIKPCCLLSPLVERPAATSDTCVKIRKRQQSQQDTPSRGGGLVAPIAVVNVTPFSVLPSQVGAFAMHHVISSGTITNGNVKNMPAQLHSQSQCPLTFPPPVVAQQSLYPSAALLYMCP